MTPESLYLLGQLLATSFACGLNLYVTVLVLGLSARFDLLPELPPGLSGIENGVVIGVAGALYVAEFAADRIPGIDQIWEAVHTLIRPAAAGLLAVLALQAAPLEIQVGAAFIAAIMALAAHGTKAGVRMILTPRWIDDGGRLQPRNSLARTAASVLEDATAVALIVTVLLYPAIAGLVVAASLALLLLAGPRFWRAALLGMRAVFARARGFFGRRGWRDRADLPRSVRQAVPLEPLGRPPARALRAAVTGLPRAGAYRDGWLVFTCNGPRFIYTSMFRVRTAALDDVSTVVLHRGVLTDTLEVRSDTARGLTLFLLKDGPPPDLTAAELSNGSP